MGQVSAKVPCAFASGRAAELRGATREAGHGAGARGMPRLANNAPRSNASRGTVFSGNDMVLGGRVHDYIKFNDVVSMK